MSLLHRPKNKDEMCNFYIMYYTNYKNKIRNTLCFKDAQKFHWSENYELPSSKISYLFLFYNKKLQLLFVL